MTSIDAGLVTGTTVGPDTDRTTSIRPFEPIGKDQLDNDNLAPIVDKFLSYILIIETKTTTTIREYEEFGECHNMIATFTKHKDQRYKLFNQINQKE